MSARPFVVVVSGTAGAGETGLVADLAAALTASGCRVATLRVDDGDLGADLDALLSADAASTVEVVVVEDPSGRARPPLDLEADLALHLQVPPDRRPSRYPVEGAAVEAAALSGADLVLDGRADRTAVARTALAAVLERLDVHRTHAGPVPAPGAVGRWHRRAARVLPQDPTGAVLLVLCTNPDAAAEPFWLAVGGGVEEAEAAREAAVRELWEETGLVADAAELVGPVHTETVVFRWGEADVVQRQEYFTVRVPDRTTTTAHLEGAEAASVLAHRWWSPAEVATTEEVVLPGLRRAVAALDADLDAALSARRPSGR